jgi:hypothetical protein
MLNEGEMAGGWCGMTSDGSHQVRLTLRRQAIDVKAEYKAFPTQARLVRGQSSNDESKTGGFNQGPDRALKKVV